MGYTPLTNLSRLGAFAHYTSTSVENREFFILGSSIVDKSMLIFSDDALYTTCVGLTKTTSTSLSTKNNVSVTRAGANYFGTYEAIPFDSIDMTLDA